MLRDGFLVIVAGPGGEDGGGAAHSLGHHHMTTGSPGEGRSSELVEYQLSELNSQGEEQGITQLSLQTCITQHRSGPLLPFNSLILDFMVNFFANFLHLLT